ncbi:MAG: fused MFS/spermidine synthase [Verrucomicrobiota bacterium]
MPVLLLFFCSGATALIYEVVWSKYLSLMFGSTIQAQTVVLAVFMGGLALGNRLFGNLAARARQPLAAYGYIEVAIGLYAFFFNWIYSRADDLFIAVGSRLLEQSGMLLLWKGALAVALLLVPTILMGGTLPLLAEWLQKNTADARRRSTRFYSTNSLGAVFGSGVAGFFLVREYGLIIGLQLTALVNVFIGFTAVALSRSQAAQPALTTPANPTEPAPAATNPAASLRTACLLVAFTGGVSMGLEVLASRCLTLIFGASLQAFAVVLMAFILGIGIGSAVIASPRFRWLQRETTTVVLLLSAATLIALFIWRIEWWVSFYATARSGFAQSPLGYTFHQILTAVMSMAVLGLPAGMLGAVLPLWIRATSDATASLAQQVGRLLTWNTVGAVIGVLLTGFVLMPKAGVRGAFGVLALVLCAAAFLTARTKPSRRLMGAAFGVTALVALALFTGGASWRHVLSSGVFRIREPGRAQAILASRPQHVKIHFYEDAADATVTLEQGDGVSSTAQYSLRINGKVDASSEGDLATQYLLGHLPILARPQSKDVFVLGFGSGITAGALLGHPIDRLVIAENCEPVLRAAKYFEPWNRGVLTNRLTRVWNEDARTVLKLSPQTYDVIISEPSNPWMAGVGSVFSREFYELCASRLKDGGVMTQWFHVYEMHDEITELILRSFTSVFPYVEVWDPGVGDIILLGSQKPWNTGAANFQQVLDRPVPRADFERIGLPTPRHIWARQLASQRTAFALPGPGEMQTDEVPILEYDAPRAFYFGINSRVLEKYDERTWQQELAPAEKRAALASLDYRALESVFKEFGTVSSELAMYFRVQSNLLERNGTETAFIDAKRLPVSFTKLTRPVSQPVGVSDPVLAARLGHIPELLRSERWPAGVESVLSLLQSIRSGELKADTSWSPPLYAAMAAKACLANSDLPRAKAVVELGLKFSGGAELRYLHRVIERELLLSSQKNEP